VADIQCATTENRRGKKKIKKDRNHSMKIYMASLLHRATIKKKKKIEEETTGQKYNGLPYSIGRP